jgi:hypothetical protein
MLPTSPFSALPKTAPAGAASAKTTQPVPCSLPRTTNAQPTSPALPAALAPGASALLLALDSTLKRVCVRPWPLLLPMVTSSAALCAMTQPHLPQKVRHAQPLCSPCDARAACYG